MPLLARVLAIGSCGVVSYLAASLSVPPASFAPVPQPVAPALPLRPPLKATSAPTATLTLVADWERFRSQHINTHGDFTVMYTSAKEIKDSLRSTAFCSALIAEWASIDPQGAFTFLRKNDFRGIDLLIREWLRIDPNAAITHILGRVPHVTLRGLLGDIARVAPLRLAEVASALPKSESHWDVAIQDAFILMAQKDPESARQAALAVKGPMRVQALAGVGKEWAERDGQAALAWAQNLPPGEERDAALKGVLTGWAKADPSAALAKLDLVPPGGRELYHASDVGAQVLRESAMRDWRGTIAWLKENPDKLGRSGLDGLQQVLYQRLKADLTGTLQSLSDSGVPGLGQVFGNALLNDGYAHRDAIWDWLEGQPSTDFTRAARGSLINALAYKEPLAALKFLDKVADQPDGSTLLQQGAQSLINGGSQMHRFEEFLANASPKLRPYLLEAGFAHGLQIHNVEQTAFLNPSLWVGRLNEIPSEHRGNAISGLARGWALADPQEALKWAQTLSDPNDRSSAVIAAASSWASTDPYEAAEWINSLPAGGSRDNATWGLITTLTQTEPESAWTWALSMGAGEIRNQALQHAYMSLQRKDPAIAQEMLRGGGLSMAERDTLLQIRTR